MKTVMERRVLLGVQKKEKEKKKPIFKQSRKRFLKKVVDYLTSDSYMYAPLISNPSPVSTARKIITSPSAGPLCFLSRMNTGAISTRKTNKKNKQQTGQLENLLLDDRQIEGCDPNSCILGQHTYRLHEMMKHIVNENYLSSSVLGSRVLTVKISSTSAPIFTDIAAAKSS